MVHTGERNVIWRVSVGKPEGKKPLGRPKRRWEDNIETDLKAVGWDVDFIGLARVWDTLRAIMIGVMTIHVL
jgi:hypothetical protein